MEGDGGGGVFEGVAVGGGETVFVQIVNNELS